MATPRNVELLPGSVMKRGQINLFAVKAGAEHFYGCISRIYCGRGRAPEVEEVLLCNDETSAEELNCILRRCLRHAEAVASYEAKKGGDVKDEKKAVAP